MRACVCENKINRCSAFQRLIVKTTAFSVDEASKKNIFFPIIALWVHTCILQNWICIANWNEISLTQLVSEGLIELWLLYYLLSSRYLAPLNSFKWCVDSENKPEEQRPGGIQGSDCTASSPLLGPGYNGGLEEKMDGRTKSLEFCQSASAPEVSLNMPAGMLPWWECFHFYEEARFWFSSKLSHTRGAYRH